MQLSQQCTLPSNLLVERTAEGACFRCAIEQNAHRAMSFWDSSSDMMPTVKRGWQQTSTRGYWWSLSYCSLCNERVCDNVWHTSPRVCDLHGRQFLVHKACRRVCQGAAPVLHHFVRSSFPIYQLSSCESQWAREQSWFRRGQCRADLQTCWVLSPLLLYSSSRRGSSQLHLHLSFIKLSRGNLKKKKWENSYSISFIQSAQAHSVTWQWVCNRACRIVV